MVRPTSGAHSTPQSGYREHRRWSVVLLYITSSESVRTLLLPCPSRQVVDVTHPLFNFADFVGL